MTAFTSTDRRALASVGAQFFINGALFASFLPRLPEIRDRVDISVDRVGLLLSLAGLAGLIGSALIGPAIGRLGTRRVILIGSACVSASLPLIGLARTPWVLLLGLAGMMTFDVLVDASMNLQGSWLSARRHAPVMSRLHGLWSLGTVVGGLSSSRLAAAGVTLPVHLVGAAVILLAALGYVGPGLLRTDEHEPGPDEAGRPDRSTPGGGLADGRLGLWLLGAAGLFALAVEATSSDWAAFRMTDDLGAAPGRAALAFVAVTAGMTIGRLAGDWATVRLGLNRLQLVANALTFTGLAGATLIDRQAAVLIGLLLAGLGTASMLPAIYDRAARQPGRPGAGMGALTAGIRVASLGIPLSVGALAGTSLSVGVAMALVTLPGVVGFVLVNRALARG